MLSAEKYSCPISNRQSDVVLWRQPASRWTDSHLDEFTIGNKRYTEYPESKEDALVRGRYRPGCLIKQNGSTFGSLYDFGDRGGHELILEESPYFNPELRTGLPT